MLAEIKRIENMEKGINERRVSVTELNRDLALPDKFYYHFSST